jgi:hypothetical protein
MECEFGNNTKAYKEGIKFIVDKDVYYKFVKNNSFCLSKTGNITYSSSKKCEYIGKVLSRIVTGKNVKYINENKLDLRRCNLR